MKTVITISVIQRLSNHTVLVESLDIEVRCPLFPKMQILLFWMFPFVDVDVVRERKDLLFEHIAPSLRFESQWKWHLLSIFLCRDLSFVLCPLLILSLASSPFAIVLRLNPCIFLKDFLKRWWTVKCWNFYFFSLESMAWLSGLERDSLSFSSFAV